MPLFAWICPFSFALGPKVQLITNGKHLTPEVARGLAQAGLSSAQLTLLSAEPARHDELGAGVSVARGGQHAPADVAPLGLVAGR